MKEIFCPNVCRLYHSGSEYFMTEFLIFILEIIPLGCGIISVKGYPIIFAYLKQHLNLLKAIQSQIIYPSIRLCFIGPNGGSGGSRISQRGVKPRGGWVLSHYFCHNCMKVKKLKADRVPHAPPPAPDLPMGGSEIKLLSPNSGMKLICMLF